MRTFSRLIAAVLLTFGATAANSEIGSGSYLAGRAAMNNNDFVEASGYFARAMTRDPSNVEIMESATLAYLSAGDTVKALAAARRLFQIDTSSQLGRLVLAAEAVTKSNYDRASELIQDPSVGPLITDLAGAWMSVGSGNMAQAISEFQTVAETSGLRDFGLYHKGLALFFVGDLEGADALFSGKEQGDVLATKRLSLAHAQVLLGLDRPDEALEVLDRYIAFEPAPVVLAGRAAIAQGNSPELFSLTSAQDGLSEVLFGLANALEGDADDVITLAYSRIAEYLRPENVDATLLSAGLLESLSQFDLATKAYDRIDPEHPAYFSAEIGRANALGLDGKPQQAIEVLRQLTISHPNMPGAFSRLGDTLRREREYEDASKAYDRAIELIQGTPGESWFLYYTRGITHERLDRWPLAEADFRKALELNPDQPQVLNYIGYSFVELQTNLDEALDMIRRAVEARPRDGYITDSLGWVYFRLGKYEDAVIWMEKAAELTPIDPVINDHLGDAFWAVGRFREARFQWNRAMSFEPEEADADRIRKKLEIGLDEVLAEEGAEPLTATNAD